MSNQPPNIDWSKIQIGGSFSQSKPQQRSDYVDVESIDELFKLIDFDIVFDIIEAKGISINDIKSSTVWWDAGFDDLDQVELIMSLEKEYDCNISDRVANDLFTVINPSEFYYKLLSNKRDGRMDQLGI